MECPSCKAENPEASIFCGQCRAPLKPDIREQIEMALEEKLKDRHVVETESVEKIWERLVNRLKYLLFLVMTILTIGGAFLAFWGYDFRAWMGDVRQEVQEDVGELNQALTEAKQAAEELRLEALTLKSETSRIDKEIGAIQTEVDQQGTKIGKLQETVEQRREPSSAIDKCFSGADLAQVNRSRLLVPTPNEVSLGPDRTDGLRAIEFLRLGSTPPIGAILFAFSTQSGEQVYEILKIVNYPNCDEGQVESYEFGGGDCETLGAGLTCSFGNWSEIDFLVPGELSDDLYQFHVNFEPGVIMVKVVARSG